MSSKEEKKIKSGRSWTPEQEKAISHTGDDMLVSAAAGAGKTAVMVERVIRIIADGSVPVTDLLVVTFTKAAASEMKEKIRTALKKRAREEEDRARSAFFREQISRLEEADISTFDSFTRRVIKQFFYLIDADPGSRVADTAESEVLKQDSLDDLLRMEFEEDRPDFISFLDHYTNEKDVDTARTMISSLYETMASLPDGESLLDKYASEQALPKDEFEKTDSFHEIMNVIAGRVDDALKMADRAMLVLDNAGCPDMAAGVKSERDQIEGIRDAALEGDLERFYDLATGYSKLTLRAKKNEKDAYAGVKDLITLLRNKGYNEIMKEIVGYASSGSGYYDDLRLSARGAATLVRLVKRLDSIYSEKKAERAVIDFYDMESLCYKILCHEEAADYYKKKYKYIFIDEYQDTSVMQEAIIGKITSGGNLFMVGDIKQSIYGFRQARPEIFLEKYKAYPSEPDDSHRIKVELNKNFRSRPNVIKGINSIFRDIMDGYDDAAALHPGLEEGAYPDAGEIHTLVLDTGGAPDDKEPKDPEKDQDKEVEDPKGVQKALALLGIGEHKDRPEYTAGELEIYETAKLVKRLLKERIRDDKGRERFVRYSDIVIILRGIRSRAEDFRKIFSEEGVPLYVDDKDGFLKTSEIGVFTDLLTIIDNRYQDLQLISVLRGVFRFSEAELAMIRKLRPTGSYAEAAMGIAGILNDGENEADAGVQALGALSGGESRALSLKLKNVFDSLDKWHEMSISMPLGMFVWRLMTESGYYLLTGMMPDPERRQANLRLLADRAGSFARDRQVSLYDFLRYIDAMKNGDFDMPQAVTIGENDDVVRLMTIHHSKGLEFPIVITGGLGNRLTYTGSKKPVLFDDKMGIGLKPRDTETYLERKSIVYLADELKLARSEIEEQLRVLYVALTRAQQRLYLIGGVKELDKFRARMEAGIMDPSTYYDMMDVFPNIEYIKASGPTDGAADIEAADGGRLSLSEEDIDEEVKRRLDYEYEYKGASDLKLKYSVSEINREYDERRLSGQELKLSSDDEELMKKLSEPENQDDVPAFIRGEANITAARRGTIYHTIMEHLDFVEAENRGMDYIHEKTAEMTSLGIISEDELFAVNLSRVSAFFKTEEGKKCVEAAESGSLQREQPFVLRVAMSGEHCYIQGIIDCWYEDEKGLVLIDYKSSRIDHRHLAEEKARVAETYAAQMRIYRQALEEATGKKVYKTLLYLFGANDFVEVSG
ncbi:MAG: UvrD-helicase domain-containing protein [Eubacteriales bacterium]|nr:UvrD-helicase domain-containing protein [Eubacteriales bacterium]